MTPPDRPAIQGRATQTGTAALARRCGGLDFYRTGWDGLTLSSVGLGTYLGEPDDATDRRYEDAVRRYVLLGGNVLDSAINYRFQRSERAIGMALNGAVAAGEMRREEIVVCTKGGYLSFDGGWPADPERWTYDTFIAPGLARPEDIVEGHCMAPAYLRHELRESRKNLQLDSIDLYYLHNPEGQRAAVGDDEFRRRLREAFATLEVAVDQGHIAAYGTATWNGYRVPPQATDFLSLALVLDAARDVAGDRHHFRAIQLPINFQMVEAASRPNQAVAGGLGTLLEAAAEHNVAVIASASLLQGRIIGRLPATLKARVGPDMSDAQRALQFVRSTPGVTTALAGMSHSAHVDENLSLRQAAPMSAEDFGATLAQ